MGEDHDLAVRGRALEHARQAVDAGGVHRLHGIVDDDEAERALGERGARDEEAQGQRVQLALAHHAEGGALDAVHGDVEDHAPAGALSRELDPPQLHVALLAEALPDPRRLLRDGREAVVADPGRRLLEPGLRGLEALEVGGPAHRVARARRARPPPRRPPDATRPPCARARARAVSRRRTTASRSGPLADSMWPASSPRSAIDPASTQVPSASDQLAQVQPHLARPLRARRASARQVFPLAAGGLRLLVHGLRLPRRLVQARRGGSRCLLAPRPSRAPSRPQTGQSASPWAAWYASAWSMSAAASRDRAAAVPSADCTAARRRAHLRAAAATRAGSGGSRLAIPRSTSVSAAPPLPGPAPASTASTAPEVPLLAARAATTRRARVVVDPAQPLEQRRPARRSLP